MRLRRSSSRSAGWGSRCSACSCPRMATGITQTVRNFGSCLGLAILGTILISSNRNHLEDTLAEEGLSKSAVAFVIALIGLPRGRVEAPVDDGAPAPGAQSG